MHVALISLSASADFPAFTHVFTHCCAHSSAHPHSTLSVSEPPCAALFLSLCLWFQASTYLSCVVLAPSYIALCGISALLALCSLSLSLLTLSSLFTLLSRPLTVTNPLPLLTAVLPCTPLFRLLSLTIFHTFLYPRAALLPFTHTSFPFLSLSLSLFSLPALPLLP